MQGAEVFPVVYGTDWVVSQLQVARDYVSTAEQHNWISSGMGQGLRAEIREIENKARASRQLGHGVCFGMDFAIRAQKL